MRVLLILTIISSSQYMLANELEKNPLCTSFFEASKDESKRSAFHSFLDEINTNDAIHTAYLGAAKALMAETVSNPYSKYNYFKDGKELIEKAVSLNPKHPEIRYVRFMIQLNTPDFLHYSDDLMADFNILKQSIESAEEKTEWMKNLISYLSANSTDFKLSQNSN